MAKYDWNINDIKSNLTDTDKIDALESEMMNQRDEHTYKIFDRHDSHQKFRKMAKSDIDFLYELSPEMAHYVLNLYKNVSLMDTCYVELPTHDISEDDLIDYIREFFDFIGDKEIITEVNEIINPDNHFLRIANTRDNDINNIVQGRVIKESTSKNAYGSFYKRCNDEDIVILCHEISHILSHRLFGNNINPIMGKYLTEVESYLFELLIGNYLGQEYNMLKLAAIFRANRFAKTVDTVWDIHILDMIKDNIFRPDLKKINKDLSRYSYPHQLDLEQLEGYKRIPILYRSKMVNSYLVALQLFKTVLEDRKQGIKLYKDLFTSDIIDYNDLINTFGINYLQDEEMFNIMKEESKNLQKLLRN